MVTRCITAFLALLALNIHTLLPNDIIGSVLVRAESIPQDADQLETEAQAMARSSRAPRLRFAKRPELGEGEIKLFPEYQGMMNAYTASMPDYDASMMMRQSRAPRLRFAKRDTSEAQEQHQHMRKKRSILSDLDELENTKSKRLSINNDMMAIVRMLEYEMDRKRREEEEALRQRLRELGRK